MAIDDLEKHPQRYVSVGDLAEYWGVSREMLYKQIKAGTLKAARIGPRLYRIRREDAIAFARQAKLGRRNAS